MEIKEILQSILEKLSEHMSSTIVFGEPREIMNRTFISVTAVSFGFGFGSGSNQGGRKKGQPVSKAQDIPKTPEEENEEPVKKISANSGNGGGGGGKAMPLGMFEITEDHTRFIPVICAKHILIGVGIMMLMMHKMCHHKCHKHDAK